MGELYLKKLSELATFFDENELYNEANIIDAAIEKLANQFTDARGATWTLVKDVPAHMQRTPYFQKGYSLWQDTRGNKKWIDPDTERNLVSSEGMYGQTKEEQPVIVEEETKKEVTQQVAPPRNRLEQVFRTLSDAF